MGHADDGFTARIELAKLADSSIDAQYYLVDDDVSGRLFLGQLLAAADRGVRVRLLIDDIDLEGRDTLLAGLDAHPHFDLRVFNPFSREGSRGVQFLSRFEEVSHRMHNKSFTVDNLVTIVGGRNIGDQYFSADPEIGFLDLDLMAVGSPVPAVSEQFDLYWNSSLAYPATVLLPGVSPDERQGALDALRKAALQAAQTPFAIASGQSEFARRVQDGAIPFRWGKAEVAYDAPGKLTPQEEDDAFLLSDTAWQYLEQVESEFILFAAYFVPGPEQMAWFRQLRDRGVRVRVLTNSLASTDVAAVHAGYARYRPELLRIGVELYELNRRWVRREGRPFWLGSGLSKASLHEKAFVIDRHQGFVGSMNFDPRSFAINTEIGIFFDAPSEAASMADWFDRHIERLAFRLELREEHGEERIRWHYQADGEARWFDTEPHTTLGQRMGVGLLGILPFEELL
jgi:putative cardiolipin synthase